MRYPILSRSRMSQNVESHPNYGAIEPVNKYGPSQVAVHIVNKYKYEFIHIRYLVVFVAGLANALSYVLRTNMSVSIVDMVNQTHHGGFPYWENQTIKAHHDGNKGGEFDWDETLQGHILGSYYYGYIATNLNGGQLADKFGARWLCGAVTLGSSLLTLATPYVARWNVYALIGLRVATGLCQGVLTPAIYSLLANWIPQNERSLVLALIQVGGNFGAIISIMFSGFLCKYGFAGGWPSVFYTFGLGGIVCFVIWMFSIYDQPEQHPWISEYELNKIKSRITKTSHSKSKKVPWIAILCSMPVWAISVAKFCGAWGNLMLMSKLPAYLEQVLHVTIEKNGYITSSVYIALSLSLTSFGYFSDWIGKKKLITDTKSRKIFETIALCGPAVCLILVPSEGCNLLGLITLLVMAMIIFGLNAGGDKPIVVDVAPDFSGTIYGITNGIASLPGILAPLGVGFLINKFGTIHGWNYAFYSAAGIYIFGAVFFLFFATAKPQAWGVLIKSRAATAYSQHNRRPTRHMSHISNRTICPVTLQRQQTIESYKTERLNSILDEDLEVCHEGNECDYQQEEAELNDEQIEALRQEYYQERRLSIAP